MVDETSASASIDQPLPSQLIDSSQNEMPPLIGPTPPTPPLVAIDPASNLAQDCGPENVSRKRKEPAKKSKQSQVWEHFVKLPLEETNGEVRASCKYCHATYACDPNKHGTTSLKRHFPKCPKNPHKATTIPKQSMLNYVTPSGQGGGLVSHVFNQKRCRRALAEFIICDEMPFRIVEKYGFRNFVRELEPRFRIPSRTTVARDCWQLYLGEIKILKQVLKKSANRVCLTTDCWTSTQNFNYLCLTCHFIDPEWKLHKRILNFCMIENHRGDTIGKTIEKCLLEWGIERVFTITMDNASSNDTALSYLKRRLRNWKGMVCGGDYLQLRCCAHILNLVVNDGLKELKNSFDAIRNAIKYVRSSPARLQKFKSVAELEKLDTTSLVCLDVNTRWNSTYLMLESALKFQKAFERLEDEDEDYMGQFIGGTKREGPPKASDWNKARVFLKFLKVFYDITLMFSSSLNVTSNTCFHQIALIHELLEENIVNVDPLLMEMSLSMRSKYEKYWGQTENMNPLLIVAVILDPRYKLAYVNHIFEQLFLDLEVCMAMKIKIKDVLYRMFDEYSKGLGTSTPSNASSSTLPGSSTCSMLEGQGGIDPGRRWLASQKEKTSLDPQSELDKYLSSNSADDTPVDDDFDILAWWRANSSKYKWPLNQPSAQEDV
ncbi:zinc finger BED domain-containing protein RICESLEEPER 1-like [Prosopis cineraria]|uniref:zinc finger BED domain-containing protein RICESLEEPER 1-like n=1 Tax=Prosopis cineraria TaxID=364024 RepID=UPI00240EE295|nr:zinc finger BED domain-containing protein RICESLEEPER 1-like [Prosopis cineraria]